MKEEILLISNSNLFSVMSRAFLKDTYKSSLLNVRYPNEYFNREQNFVQQAKELFQERLINRGLISNRHSFSFNEKIIKRVENLIKAKNPKMTFLEMITFEESEWLLLSYLISEFKMPLAVFTNVENNSKELETLIEFGVKDILLTMDEDSFKRIAKRSIARIRD